MKSALALISATAYRVDWLCRYILGASRGWLWLLSRLAKNKNISWMQRIAIHNLARKGNQSALFFVTLSLSVAVLTLITTLNHSINAQFVNAYLKMRPIYSCLMCKASNTTRLIISLAHRSATTPSFARVSLPRAASRQKISMPMTTSMNRPGCLT